jgi:hypothetical protein
LWKPDFTLFDHADVSVGREGVSLPRKHYECAIRSQVRVGVRPHIRLLVAQTLRIDEYHVNVNNFHALGR